MTYAPAAPSERLASIAFRLLRAVTVSCAGLGASAALAATPPPTLVNAYQLIGTVRPEAWLKSSVECGTFRCDIHHTVSSLPLDYYVQIAWYRQGTATQHGPVILQTDTAYLSNLWSPQAEVIFDGYLEAEAWDEGMGFNSWLVPPVRTEHGVADFTGSIGILDPCSDYICQNADYYAWYGAPTPAGNGLAPPAPGEVTIGVLTGTLSRVGLDPAHPEADSNGPRLAYATFESAVDAVGTQYRYRYSITNFTDLPMPYDWALASMNGELGPGETTTRSFMSDAAPTVLLSEPDWQLKKTTPFVRTGNFSASLNTFAPVPEPATWTLLAGGIVALGLGLRHRGKAATS